MLRGSNALERSAEGAARPASSDRPSDYPNPGLGVGSLRAGSCNTVGVEFAHHGQGAAGRAPITLRS
ncbi:hypothetical protein JHV675_24160 [Mycobacterium avium subsp. hominissuis]